MQIWVNTHGNPTLLGTISDLKYPQSLSNENLFSCDKEMWENLNVWSHRFTYIFQVLLYSCLSFDMNL